MNKIIVPGNAETILRPALPGDFQYIDHLRKKEGDALGFIPKDTYLSILHKKRMADRDRWKYGKISVTEDNGDLTGYCYYTHSGDWVKVVQIAIQQDARRWHRAMLIIDEVEQFARANNKLGITCRVAYDLESNLFWLAMGYDPVDTVVSSSFNRGESISKRPLIVYTKSFGGLLGLMVKK